VQAAAEDAARNPEAGKLLRPPKQKRRQKSNISLELELMQRLLGLLLRLSRISNNGLIITRF